MQYLTGAEQQAFGFAGIITAAAIVFFAYIGFDVVATTSEEARNPQRDLPIGILASLAICTILYVVVSLILTGMVPYTDGAPLNARDLQNAFPYLNTPIPGSPRSAREARRGG